MRTAQQPDGEGDIQHAKPGNDPARGGMQQVFDQVGITRKEPVLLPLAHPRQKDQQDSQLKEYKNHQHAEESVHIWELSGLEVIRLPRRHQTGLIAGAAT